MRLHGELALRIEDWVDYDDFAQPFNNRVIDMGFLFRNASSEVYDGMRAKFLYNTTQTNDAEAKGYSRNFIVEDFNTTRLNMTANETHWMTTDVNFTDWQFLSHKSRKVCLDFGQCAFIVGFTRELETNDTLG